MASAKVVGSGTVGPDAITSRGSPITSERIRVTRVAGAAALAKCPPFTFDRCLRIQFISLIFAPDFSKISFTAFKSASEHPSGVSAIKADPPPEIRQITRSSFSALLTIDIIFPVPVMPFSSGTG